MRPNGTRPGAHYTPAVLPSRCKWRRTCSETGSASSSRAPESSGLLPCCPGVCGLVLVTPTRGHKVSCQSSADHMQTAGCSQSFLGGAFYQRGDPSQKAHQLPLSHPTLPPRRRPTASPGQQGRATVIQTQPSLRLVTGNSEFIPIYFPLTTMCN